ncbi:MAG: hypothetical protein ACOX9C_04295 [Kiritimatiellia bacterium]|jgi:hypothetical protein
MNVKENQTRLRRIVLAFVAERYPAAYTADAIRQRVNQSGMLDAPATTPEVLDALRTLASDRFHWADLMVDEDGVQHWGATPAGVRHWTLTGSLYVGG